ncbi:MAG: hypothetical protein ACI9RO_000657 [Alteromonas macleodii]|jgi:hypothetical protein
MNICMRGTFECTWDNMIARLEANMASASDAHTSWTAAQEGENGIIFMANIVDFEALGSLMINEDQLKWDKDNGVEYAAYTMQPMGD